MVILIAGDTHTGKTLLAQRLLDKHKYPYLSIDHLKMGLIRSGRTSLSAESSDDELTGYIWPIVREMIKTCIENSQNLIVEGCYIPFYWKEEFTIEYLNQIKYICLIFSEEYIKHRYTDIIKFENTIENRQSSELAQEEMIKSNKYNLQQCQEHGYNYLLIDSIYKIDIDSL